MSPHEACKGDHTAGHRKADRKADRLKADRKADRKKLLTWTLIWRTDHVPVTVDHRLGLGRDASQS